MAGQKYCGDCGTPWEWGSRFCSSCGSPADDEAASTIVADTNAPGQPQDQRQPTPALIVMTRIFAWASVVALIIMVPLEYFVFWTWTLLTPVYAVLVVVPCIFLITKYRALDPTMSRWPFVTSLVGLGLAVASRIWFWLSNLDFLTYFGVWVVPSLLDTVLMLALNTLGIIVSIQWLLLPTPPKPTHPQNSNSASGHHLDPYGNPAYALTPAGVPFQRASRSTYLLPIFFGFIGGVLGWAIVKDRDPILGKSLLITGLIMGIALFLLPLLFYLVFFVVAINS